MFGTVLLVDTYLHHLSSDTQLNNQNFSPI
jgi:hypothetical protein